VARKFRPARRPLAAMMLERPRKLPTSREQPPGGSVVARLKR
jgi:hypothetical protein